MKTNHKTLAQFLAGINLTEQQLKQRTGIPLYRLRAIYKDGKFTDAEFKKLAEAIGVRTAVSLAYACQIGDFNQNGDGNTQVIINNIMVFVMRHIGLAVEEPQALPVQPVLVSPVQHLARKQMPSGQAAPVGSSFMSTSCIS